MTRHTDAWEGWPPPAEDLWLVHGTMGAPIAAMDDEGAGRAVLLRIGARRNHHSDEDDRTYLLGVREVASILSGLISMGNAAFGHAALQEAMAEALHMTDEDRLAARQEADRRLRDMP